MKLRVKNSYNVVIEELLSLPVLSNPSKMASKKEETGCYTEVAIMRKLGVRHNTCFFSGVKFFFKHMLFVACKYVTQSKYISFNYNK